MSSSAVSSSIQAKAGSVVLPGDVVGTVGVESESEPESEPEPAAATRPLRLGPGLIQDKHNVVATKAGVLRQGPGRMYWIENHQKHYSAALGDLVLGVISDRHRDGYFVDIGASEPAKLDSLAFPGATKRNKPDLQPGYTVYGRVCLAHRDMAPEITCVGTDGHAGGLGELKGGTLLKLPISLARRLLSGSCVVMAELGKHLAFEVAVGVNGFVWVNAAAPATVVVVCNAVTASEYLSPAQCREMVKLVIDKM